MSLLPRVQSLLALVLLALLCAGGGASAYPAATDGTAAQPSPDTRAETLIVGVTAVEKPDEKQSDAIRNIRVYTYLYNNTPVPQVVDWRTRRLKSAKVSAFISEPEEYGLFLIAPGEIVLMRSFFYYKTGFPGAFTFSVRDRDQRVYSVPAVPQATSIGAFSSLPVALQWRLVQTMLAQQAEGFKWWYLQY